MTTIMTTKIMTHRIMMMRIVLNQEKIVRRKERKSQLVEEEVVNDNVKGMIATQTAFTVIWRIKKTNKKIKAPVM